MSEMIYLNGFNGDTGDYLFDPMSTEEAAKLARGKPLSDGKAAGEWLKRILNVIKTPFQGLPMDVDPTDVAQAGWGVVFSRDASPEIREALQPLIVHRQSHLPADRCKVLDYSPGQGLKDWLKSYGVHAGAVAPTKVPYYLLLVGDPSEIPFQFQYLLDIEYAVGRLCFDQAEQYHQYANSLIDQETADSVLNDREIVYWGVRHDKATELSADYLISPLYEGEKADEVTVAQQWSYESRCFSGEDATKDNLLRVLRGGDGGRSPAMLCTASHGLGWKMEQVDHQRQRMENGALFSQDWPGEGPVHMDQYITSQDIGADAKLHGLVAFMFACYGAGTPAHNYYLRTKNGPEAIAERPFVAALPQRLLSHPGGGALAVLGHVDMAWSYSFKPPKIGQQLQPFRNLIGRILNGQPVGHSTKDLSERYAILSAELLSQLDVSQPGDKPSERKLARTWIERNDAQNYIMLGDPAARVRMDNRKDEPPSEREVLRVPVKSSAAQSMHQGEETPDDADDLKAKAINEGRPTDKESSVSADQAAELSTASGSARVVKRSAEDGSESSQPTSFMAAPSPLVSAPQSEQPAQVLLFFRGALRELRTLAQTMHDTLSQVCSTNKTELTEDSSDRAEGIVAAMVEAQGTCARSQRQGAALLQSIRQILSRQPSIYDWCSDEVTRIEHNWHRFIDCWPKRNDEPDQIVGDSLKARDALEAVIYHCGRLTIPARVEHHLSTLRIGQALDFSKNFRDELTSDEECQRLLRYMADHPHSVAGIVDVDAGVVYRASKDWRRRLLSYGMLLTMVVAGVPLIAAITQFGPRFNIEDWPPTGHFQKLVGVYVMLIAGSIGHLIVGALKQAREAARSGLSAIDDWLLWVHVRESSLLISIFYLWVGLLALAFLPEQITVPAAFFVGYGIDSFVDLFLQRFSQTATANMPNLSKM